MPNIIIGETEYAARLLAYVDTDKPEQSMPRVLHAAGVRCGVNTAVREFAAVRRQYGTQGRARRAPAKYTLPDDGEIATHVRHVNRSGRGSWRVAKPGETATHVRHEGVVYEQVRHGDGNGTHKRIGKNWVAVDPSEATHRQVEGGYVREREAVHVIVPFHLSEVDPNDPNDVRRAFDYALTMITSLFPGTQMKLVGQADGKGKNFHVHCVVNATAVEEMGLDGKVWRPGQKLSGALTDINRLRQRHDEFMIEHPEFGFAQLSRSVDEQKDELRSTRDRRMAAEGTMSNRDIIRTRVEQVMDDPHATTIEEFKDLMESAGVHVHHRETKTGRNNGRVALSYRLTEAKYEMKQNVRGTTLGTRYSWEGIVEQLEANANGTPRKQRWQPEPPHPVKRAPTATEEERAEARELMEELAREEELDEWIDDWAREENTTAKGLLRERHMHRTDPDDRVVLRDWMEQWKHEKKLKEKKQSKATPKSKPAKKYKGKVPSEAEPRQPNGRISEGLLDISAYVNEKAAPYLTDPEQLLREFRGRSDHDDRHHAATPPRNPQEPTEQAPTAPVPASAPEKVHSNAVTSSRKQAKESENAAPDHEKGSYRSGIRDATSKSESGRRFVRDVADFDEEARAVLARGDRINEASVPKGIGRKFLDTYGDQLDPTVAKQLWMRQRKKEAASRAFEEKKKAQQALAETRTKAEQAGDVTGNWMYKSSATDLIRERNVAERRMRALRDQIAAGIYEEVKGKSPRLSWPDQQEELQKQNEPEIG